MTTNESDDVPYCQGHLRGRQSGFTCINTVTNDWGCGGCRKPTKLYWERIIRPREEMTNAAAH